MFVRNNISTYVSRKRTMYKVVVKFRMTDSKLNKNKIQKRYVLNADIFNHIGPRKVTSPSKSLHQLAVRSGVSKSTARQATKLKTTIVFRSPQIYVISTRLSRRQCWTQREPRQGTAKVSEFNEGPWLNEAGIKAFMQNVSNEQRAVN